MKPENRKQKEIEKQRIIVTQFEEEQVQNDNKVFRILQHGNYRHLWQMVVA